MKLSIEVQSYDTCGGAMSTTLAGEFLWEYLRGLEPETLEIVVTACFRSRGQPGRALGGMFRDYQKALSTLPKLRYSPKRERVEIQYLSAMVAEDVIESSEPQLDSFRNTVREVAALLPELLGAHKLLRRLLPLPQLDAAITEALAHLPATEEAMQVFDTAQQGRVLAERLLRSPWEKLGVDWAEYHPEARDLLDDPFYWDAVDEYAPHGNDTGADLLEAFREWRSKHREAPASRFLPLMLKRWDYSSDVEALQSKPLADWDEDDELTMEVLDEATIAIAFAQLKLEGRCDEDVRAAALASIARQLDPAVHAHFEWTVPKDRIDRLQLVQAKLRG
jgi:uncharacterized protein YfeS